jgi:hypothetical protein
MCGRRTAAKRGEPVVCGKCLPRPGARKTTKRAKKGKRSVSDRLFDRLWVIEEEVHG